MTPENAQVLTDAPDGQAASVAGQPAWVAGELPPEYGELQSKIRALREEAGKYEKIAAVLWQTGRPLVLAVRDLFRAMNLQAEATDGEDAAYDIAVDLEGERRLLIEVAGSTEALTRKAPQIGRIVRALQEDARDRDRIVVVANTHCDVPPDARPETAATADALRLVQGLGANLITTTTLFGIWRYSLKDTPGARKSLMRLHSQDGGIFR